MRGPCVGDLEASNFRTPLCEYHVSKVGFIRKILDMFFVLSTFVYRIMYLRQIVVALRAYGTEVEV